MVAANEERCLAAVGADPGDWVTVNITPVEATTAGFGTIHSSDNAAGATSNVNFTPGGVDPNTATAPVGTDGKICFTNSYHGPVHLVLDQLTVSPPTTFTTPTPDGAARLADTRIGLGGPRLAANEKRCLAAVGADPGDWVTVNITPVEATTAGFGTIHSSDNAAGATSNVNFTPGGVDPNTATAPVGTDGKICFTNSYHGPVHLVLDQLTVSPPTTFTTPTPDGAARLADTRIGLGGPRLAANEKRCLTAEGADPGDWVTVNITPVEATTAGFGTIHSSDNAAGATSNVNFTPGGVDPNTATAPVGTDGKICFTNSYHGPVHLVLDQLTVSPPTTFTTPTPDGAARLTDTRPTR